MAKPPLNGVAETEYTKSHLRGFSPPLFLIDADTGGIEQLFFWLLTGL